MMVMIVVMDYGDDDGDNGNVGDVDDDGHNDGDNDDGDNVTNI